MVPATVSFSQRRTGCGATYGARLAARIGVTMATATGSVR